jgi:hypothetical protein
MAIKVGGVTVINDSRGLENITDGLSAAVKKPSITTPTNGQTGFDALSGSSLRIVAPFHSLYGIGQLKSQVVVSPNADFSSPIIDYTSNTDTITYAVTVANPGGGNKFYINGSQVSSLTLYEGRTYRFDQSNATNATHPLRFSTTSNGTHNSGAEYTTGVTTAGTPGNAGAYTEITVAAGTATLYVYCSSHSGMGWEVPTSDSKITFDFDTLQSGLFSTSTQYYIQVRHTDVDSISSEYSDSISITTPSSFSVPNAPAISDPSNGDSILGNPTITASTFAMVGNSDTHASSDWQVATDSSFTTIVDSSIGDTSNLTSYIVQTTLATSTTHYIRVRYNSATYGSSDWSSTITATTVASYSGEEYYTTWGDFTWTVPGGVTEVSMIGVGGGAGASGSGSGGGGASAWINAVAVTAGADYTINVGRSGHRDEASSDTHACATFICDPSGNVILCAGGGCTNAANGGGDSCIGANYTSLCYGLGTGGHGNNGSSGKGGGGGAAGYGAYGAGAAAGANGGSSASPGCDAICGGGGGGGGHNTYDGGAGGGVGVFGQGTNGTGGGYGSYGSPGTGGSGGNCGPTMYGYWTCNGANSGTFGGASGAGSAGAGRGTVRIIWGSGRSFPTNAS